MSGVTRTRTKSNTWLYLRPKCLRFVGESHLPKDVCICAELFLVTASEERCCHALTLR